MDVRDPLQQSIVKTYLEKDPLRATIVLGTGLGKSKVAIDIIKALNPPKTFILSNSQQLRDDSWKKEFENFGLGDYYRDNVVSETYQKVYKWSPNEHPLDDYFIICDEIDFIANTPEYARFLPQYKNVKMLALTGFITASKEDWFARQLPVIFRFSTLKGIEEGYLNKIEFKLVKFALNNSTNFKVEYKKQGKKAHFYTSESKAYIYAEKALTSAYIKLSEVESMGSFTEPEELREMRNNAFMRIRALQNSRGGILSRLDSAVATVNKIKAVILKGTKTLIFSNNVAQSKKLAAKTFNGKNTKKNNVSIFKDFNEGKITTLGVCGKVNRGTNMRELFIGIMESFNSSDTIMNQRLGRFVRLKPDQIATIYILLPYYREFDKDKKEYVLKETAQVRWARTALNIESKTESWLNVCEYSTIDLT